MSIQQKIRGTIETVLRFGLGGPQVKNNAGALEARNSADSDFAIMRGQTAVSGNDLITFAQWSAGVPLPTVTLPTIAGLAWHVQADAGITLAQNNQVSAWADQSGSGDPNKNASQATSALQPYFLPALASFGGRAVVNFPSASSGNSLLVTGAWVTPIAGDRTIFMVCDTGITGTTMLKDTVSQGIIRDVGGTSTIYQAFTGGTVSTPHSVKNLPSIIYASVSGTNELIAVGSELFQGTATPGGSLVQISGMQIGGPGTVIAEILVYNAALSDANAMAVLAYLAAKYSLPLPN